MVRWVVQASVGFYFIYCVGSFLQGTGRLQEEGGVPNLQSSSAVLASAPVAAVVPVAAPEPPPSNRLEASHKARLQTLLEDLQAELALYQEEIPASFMKPTVSTPFDGEVPDRHQVVDATCPRYVTMEKPPHGLGHQMGTVTTALITALFFGLTYVNAPFTDNGYHGVYPGIGEFTGLAEGELTLAEVEGKVSKVIEVTEMPVEPTSDNLQVLYEPLRQAFQEKYKDECNVLFKVRDLRGFGVWRGTGAWRVEGIVHE